MESQAYDKLFEFTRLDLLVNPRVVKMVDLREKLMIYLRSMGATETSESTKKRARRKLQKEFGDLLKFEDLQNNNKLFVLPKNLSKLQLAREMVRYLSNYTTGILHLKSRKCNKLACTSVTETL